MLLDAALRARARGIHCPKQNLHAPILLSSLPPLSRFPSNSREHLRPLSLRFRATGPASSSNLDGETNSTLRNESSTHQEPLLRPSACNTIPCKASANLNRRLALSSTLISSITLGPLAAGPASAAPPAESDTSIKSMLQQAMDSIGGKLPNPRTPPTITQPVPDTKPALPPSSRHSRAGINLPLVQPVTLPSGLVVSKVIKGCLQLDGRFRGDPTTDRTSGTQATSDFDTFVEAGITSFDVADVYGSSEAMLGQYLRLYPWRRDEVQVLTKISIMGDEMRTITKDLLEYRIRSALVRTGAGHLDLVQLHWDDFREKRYLDVALWLTDLQKRGMVRAIGVTNFDVPRLLQLLDAGVPVVSNQVQLSVLDRRPLLYLAPLCKSRKVALLAYGTVAGGLVSNKSIGMEAKEVRLDTPSKAKYGQVLRMLGGWTYMKDLMEVLEKIARKHNVSIAVVASRWALQQEAVSAVILGARNSRHIRDMRVVASASWQGLDDDDLMELDVVYEGATQQPTSDVYIWERGGAWAA